MNSHGRRAMVAVIGSAGTDLPDGVIASAEAIGRAVVDVGCGLVTGGLGGVMEAASRGARSSVRCTEGSVVGILPGYDRSAANPHVQLAIPTGMQIARNVLVVASADVVVALHGGSGTLSEIAIAWQLGKPVVAVSDTGGWAQKLAGERLDHRHEGTVYAAEDAAVAIQLVLELVATTRTEPGDVNSGWRGETQ